jgi:site-specific recombinase XerD|tara:strand:- start:1250 stop:2125 length:876 start_codon:yes stop_codon:yes gene_type:complete
MREAAPRKTPIGVKHELALLSKRMTVANRSCSSIRSYCRAIEKLSIFQQDSLRSLEIDQLIDFLYHLHHDKGLNWRTIKLYVAGLRYYYQEVVDNVALAHQIPYPKEKPSLPVILSRQELQKVFDGCLNYKHKVMFRLIYSAGLRRSELANLKIKDIETLDGKMRIRINNGKGGKDRYTVLAQSILEELRIYVKMSKPKIYLFNGRIKGEPMSLGGIRHALVQAVKRSNLNKEVNLHILRHCFASHALEDGLNIKTLQYLLGHQSIKTTLIYLHVSEVPLTKAFSPLDNWD